MSASKLADLYGSLPGYVIETADGDQAYPQAKMASPVKTWVRLPRDRWPESWSRGGSAPPGGYKDPVVLMRQALYGHPDAGGYWERHCEAGVEKAGFLPVGSCGEWRSCFFNPRTKVFLIVYVDDFKMAGPEHEVAKAWKDIGKHPNYRTRTVGPIPRVQT